MVKKCIVLDGVFTPIDFLGFRDKAFDGEYDNKWFDYNDCTDWCADIVDTAAAYFPLAGIQGYETWCHDNTRPESDNNYKWHYDKNEYKWQNNKKLVFPIFTAVIYLKVSDLKGGNLLFEDGVSIKPKENRLVLFGPGVKHRVEEFTGKRFSLSINPWTTKLEEYK